MSDDLNTLAGSVLDKEVADREGFLVKDYVVRCLYEANKITKKKAINKFLN